VTTGGICNRVLVYEVEGGTATCSTKWRMEQQHFLILRVLRVRTSWFRKFAGLLRPFRGETGASVVFGKSNGISLCERVGSKIKKRQKFAN
jgi:hypothetical protein